MRATVLSSRAVRDELKATVKEEGLPELYFSSIAEERCDYAYYAFADYGLSGPASLIEQREGISL
jgi:hypothetical protein